MSTEPYKIPTNFEYFNIDTSDIWQYEMNSYNGEEERLLAFYQHYDDLKQLLLNNDIQPFLSPETVKKGTHSQQYYDDYKYKRLPKRDRGFVLDFFEHNDNFYSFLKPFIINPKKCSELDFQKFFYLKLKQYKNGLTFIHQFLYHQLKENFNKDQSKFFEFLRLLLLQYESYLASAIMLEVNNFISDPKIISSFEKIDRTGYTDFPDIPDGYRIIKGKLDREEIIKFFSFLFQEKSEKDKPFLSEKDTYDIFKFGIAIPPYNIPIPSYKLNCSKKCPKSIIEYSIHKFYMDFTDDAALKQEILRFFAIYFEDFNNALSSEKDLRNLGKNITGEKPVRMKFDIDNYRPDRLK